MTLASRSSHRPDPAHPQGLHPHDAQHEHAHHGHTHESHAHHAHGHENPPHDLAPAAGVIAFSFFRASVLHLSGIAALTSALLWLVLIWAMR